MAVIESTALRKAYARNLRAVQALDGVSFAVDAGQVLGVLGPNGAGKTTLLKVLSGITRADSGQVQVFGAPDPAVVQKRIGFLPEQPEFFGNVRAGELLRFCLRLSTGDARPGVAEAVLERVGLAGEAGSRVARFSKGMAQRLGLAQAIVHDPELLILDEPLSGLDPLGRRLVARLIDEYRRAGRAVLYSTHDLDDIESACTHVLVLDRGTVRFRAEMAELRRLGAFTIEAEGPAGPERFGAAGEEELWRRLEEIRGRGLRLVRVQPGAARLLEGYFEPDA